jgi:hypothetical protein
MTDAELDRIESALRLKLPTFYRQFMRAYPSWLLDRQPKWANVSEWELPDDPDRVIYFNQCVRRAEPGEYFDDRPWPHHYFVIGSEMGQNWYFLDLEEGGERVYWYHHEMGEVSEISKTLDKFPDTLLEDWADIESAG